MSIEKPELDWDGERPIDDEPRTSPPPTLDRPVDADEADVLEQTLEAPPDDD